MTPDVSSMSEQMTHVQGDAQIVLLEQRAYPLERELQVLYRQREGARLGRETTEGLSQDLLPVLVLTPGEAVERPGGLAEGRVVAQGELRMHDERVRLQGQREVDHAQAGILGSATFRLVVLTAARVEGQLHGEPAPDVRPDRRDLPHDGPRGQVRRLALEQDELDIVDEGRE